jgi:3-oxoacyl-[acyl-carrier protein] reductase
MDLQLAGKTALIFGGSKGIGRGIADAMAAEGAAVAIVARTQATIDASVAEIKSRGGSAIGAAADLANWASVENAVKDVRGKLGSIDILVNNSGGPPPSGVVGVKPELWEAQFHAMVLSIFRITDMVVPEMRSRRWGRILNVASYSVVEPIPSIGISNTLRSAIVGWAKTLAGEVGRDGITVNTLLPGVIATERSNQLRRAQAKALQITEEEVLKRTAQSIPVGRVGTPEEFGAIAAFLASPLAGYVTGSLIRIDGGLTRSI